MTDNILRIKPRDIRCTAEQHRAKAEHNRFPISSN